MDAKIERASVKRRRRNRLRPADGRHPNAIFNATGVRITKLLFSPDNVLRALKAAGKA
ncbi:MAG: hypothetical protein WD688_19540 [Candidatus Binatia bacterium]